MPDFSWVPWVMLVCGTIGVFAAMFVERRQLRRRNSAGVEEFPSYFALVRARAFEWTITFFARISFLLGFGALIYLLGRACNR